MHGKGLAISPAGESSGYLSRGLRVATRLDSIPTGTTVYANVLDCLRNLQTLYTNAILSIGGPEKTVFNTWLLLKTVSLIHWNKAGRADQPAQ
jgi:hypothetical protein